MQSDDYTEVILADRHIIPSVNIHLLNTEVRHPFTYELSEAIRVKSNERFNTIIVYNRNNKGANQLFTYLGRIQRHRMRWMFDEHHFQKHWQFYAGSVIVPVVLALTGKWTGLWRLIEQILLNTGK
jgi:hypothetical protein